MLAVIGDIVQDIVVWQREKVRPATDTASDIFIQRGGSAANVAAFAGPRTPTRFIGCVGDDLAGLVLTRELESHGVEVKNQVRGADGATGTIVLQIDLDGERSMFPSRGASAMLTTIDPAWVAGVDLLHLTAYSFETPGPRDAVIEAAAHLGRLFSGQVTAAGKFPPATVYVIGAGVAGLSAIGTACSLGAQVRGSDVRPEVADQVRSMGAQFVPLPSAQEVSSDGYAKEMSADQASAANALYAQQAAESDVVITTASIPGRRAPVLLDRSAIEAMRPGSVIIDMAAATSGNTELTVPGEVVSTEGGVTIVGHTDLAGMLPAQATQLYGRNIVNLLGLITPHKDGALTLDLDDEVIRAITVTHDGELLWPPPPIQVSATPAPSQPEQTAADDAAAQETARAAQARSRSRQWLGLAAATLVAAALVLVTPSAATSHYIVLMLSVILGFHVISNVTPALHTPLMSVTNAISGIILVGAISQVGHPHPLISAISLAAVVLATINIVGGFAVTHRMLAMFTKD